ncbi:MAG: tetratricopeptide repeat protein [Cytophagaceae bacterium]|nr:MAG: tetratricopeptide repeat protein [Cytophagaceae bacterium]
MSTCYSTREVVRFVDLPPACIRQLARAGVVGQTPPAGAAARIVYGRTPLAFDFCDIQVLRAVARLAACGVAVQRLVRVFIRLHRQVKAYGGRLSAIQLTLEGDSLYAQAGQRRWDVETGQTCLGFAAGPATAVAPPVSLPGTADSEALSAAKTPQPLGARSWTDRSADSWFDLALAMEESDPQGAYELYLRAIACEPAHVEAMLNIGRLCSLWGDRRRAMAYFRVASRIDPQHPVAHFNMAVTLHDAGELAAALGAYRRALRYDPFFADAHYNLATLLEQRGARDEASQHFVAYRLAVRPGPPA